MRIKAYGEMPKRWGGIKCERCHESDLIETRSLPDGKGWYFWCGHCRQPLNFESWFSDL